MSVKVRLCFKCKSLRFWCQNHLLPFGELCEIGFGVRKNWLSLISCFILWYFSCFETSNNFTICCPVGRMTKKFSPTPGKWGEHKIWSSCGPEVKNRRHAFPLLPGLSVNTKFCAAIEHWVPAKLKESSQPHLIEFISITSKESLFKNITDLRMHMVFYFFSSTLPALSFNTPSIHIWDGDFAN